MRLLKFTSVGLVVLALAAQARADEPPPAPPPAPEVPPARAADVPPPPPPPPMPAVPPPCAPDLPAPPPPPPEMVAESLAPGMGIQPADVPCPPAPCAPRCRSVRLTLEGLWGFLPDPEGPFGQESFFPNQLRWDALSFDPQFGGRGALEVRLGEGSSLELRGAWLGGFEDSAIQTGVFGFSPATPAPPMVPGLIPGVSAVNTGTFTSEAELWSAEGNFRHTFTCSSCLKIEGLLGARAISFTEEALATNFATAFVPGFPLAPFASADVDNLFLGAQAGVAVHWLQGRSWEWNLALKGMLGNLHREIDVADRGIFAGAAHAGSLSEDEIVFGMEFEAGARWQLSDGIALTGGYTLLFLDNVQRANDAMFFGASTSGAVQAQSNPDQLIVHALFFGVSLDF